MTFADITTPEELHAFMTEPSAGLIASLSRIHGPIMILGGSGKMGPELVALIRRADREAGVERELMVASTFSNPRSDDRARLETLGVQTFRGDLSDRAFLAELPDAPNVVYMPGFKFGSSSDWRRTFHLNAVMPYLVGERYNAARIVAFSSGNPYAHTDPARGGEKEDAPLAPQGVYGWSIVARESAFATTAMQFPEQQVCIYRLMYAQHLGYGVLVDLARMILRGETISLAMPSVNLVSQRDANEVAIRSLEHCATPPLILNVAGWGCAVRDIVEQLASHLDTTPVMADDEGGTALLGNDDHCRRLFGPYRDQVSDMIAGAARWVKNRGEYWEKPTMFGKVSHEY